MLPHSRALEAVGWTPIGLWIGEARTTDGEASLVTPTVNNASIAGWPDRPKISEDRLNNMVIIRTIPITKQVRLSTELAESLTLPVRLATTSANSRMY